MRQTLACLASPDAAEIDFGGPIEAACRDLAAEADSDPAHCVVQESGGW